ncbi:MAG: M20/M25/M40 family metallo-hydrolase [Hyphomicrobiales bacterium]
MTLSDASASGRLPAQVSNAVDAVEAAREGLLDVTRTLVRIPTETPPSDTRATVRVIAEMLSGFENVETTIHTSEPPIDNLVAKTCAGTPGRRLILNGHLDTYPAGDRAHWTDDPFSGVVRDGKLYGRGSADMKGGVACLLHIFKTLAQMPDAWAGELCLVLAGDEESMGTLGSQFLLDTVPDARGDAVLNADVGSPTVPRIGEKGMIWINVFAEGRPAHGAHVHRGENAIDTLRRAMDALTQLHDYPVNTPCDVARAIRDAKPVSEPLGGTGEADVLQRITVNFGRVEGGKTANLVPDWAEANADIRLPMGVSVGEIEAEISRLLEPLNGIRFEIVRRYEPTWTSPDEPVVTAVLQACRTVLGQAPTPNMRVGGSDARLYRAAGIPTVVCGLTPHNLGGPDEYVEIDELVDVTRILLLAALRYLQPN